MDYKLAASKNTHANKTYADQCFCEGWWVVAQQATRRTPFIDPFRSRRRLQ